MPSRGGYSSRNRIIIGLLAGVSILLAAAVLLRGANPYPGGLFGMLQQHPGFPRSRHAQSVRLTMAAGAPQTGALHKDAPPIDDTTAAATGMAGELQPAEGNSKLDVSPVALQREVAMNPVDQAAILSANRLPAEPAAGEITNPAADEFTEPADASVDIFESNPISQAVFTGGMLAPGPQANDGSEDAALQAQGQGPDAAENQQVQAIVSDPQVVAAIAAGLQMAVNASKVGPLLWPHEYSGFACLH